MNNEDKNLEEAKGEALMDLAIKDKCRTFKMFKQLKAKDENFAFDVILGYVRALNEYLGLSNDEMVLRVSVLYGISDLFFDNDYIVFLDPDKKEIMRVFAPC